MPDNFTCQGESDVGIQLLNNFKIIFMICIKYVPPPADILVHFTSGSHLFHTAVTCGSLDLFCNEPIHFRCPHKSNGICLFRLMLKHELENTNKVFESDCKGYYSNNFIYHFHYTCLICTKT
jgi:hypothetical protein